MSFWRIISVIKIYINCEFVILCLLNWSFLITDAVCYSADFIYESCLLLILYWHVHSLTSENEMRGERWPPPPIIQPVLARPPGVRGPDGNEFTLLPAEARAWQTWCAYQAQRTPVIPGAQVTNDDTNNILRWLITPTYTTHYTNLASNSILISLLYSVWDLFDHLKDQDF